MPNKIKIDKTIGVNIIKVTSGTKIGEQNDTPDLDEKYPTLRVQ